VREDDTLFADGNLLFLAIIDPELTAQFPPLQLGPSLGVNVSFSFELIE
jgi:hypothetical protein